MAMPKNAKPTAGYINKLIDDLIHPHTKNYPVLILVGALLHALIEQDANTSLRKFVRYNAYPFLRQISRSTKHRHRPQFKETT